MAPAPYGGLEQVVSLLTRGLRAHGHDVHVATLLKAGTRAHPFVEGLEGTGVRVHRVFVGSRSYLAERSAIASLCRELRPDVVHTHGYRPDVVDGSVARRAGVPVITTLHGFTGGSLRNRLYEFAQRRAARSCDAVVVVSRPLAALLRRAGVGADRIEVIPNAWNARGADLLTRAAARRALGVPEAGVRIGWVGRLTAEKGADVFIAAAERLVDLGAAFSVVGDGAERTRLETQAAAVHLDGQLTWHGPVTQSGRLFAAFDAFVLSSRTEGTPITLFEAMHAGVPIVATTVGGVPDVVSEREAVLVPPEDPEALAQAIRGVVADVGSARARADAARARLLRTFALRPWIERYEAVYRRVARGGMRATTAAMR